MKTLRYALAALFFLGVAQAQIIGGGFFYGGSAPSSYQGPGDVASGAIVFGSCARAYNAAFAATQGAICQIADVGTGAITCDLKVGTNGFADLSSASCAGGTLTVPAFCTAHTSCVVSKFYDQTGHGNNMTQATLSVMPALVFSMLNSLPGVQCTAASAQNLSSPNITQAQPFAYVGVMQRSSGSDNGVFIGTLGIVTQLAGDIGGAPNSWNLQGTVGGFAGTVSDSAFHAALGQFNTTSALYVDGSSLATGSIGTTGLSANSFRICRGNAAYSSSAKIMEVGLWPADESANAAALSTNQHSATNGYNF